MTEYIQSSNHPDLTNGDFPATTNASLPVQSSAAVDSEPTVTSDAEATDANEQKREGKNDLAQFIANRGSKAVEEALTVGWELEEAEKKLERSNG